MDRGLDGYGFTIDISSTMKNISSKSYVLLAGLPLAYLAIFYFYPLIKIFSVSFIPDDAWGSGNLKKLVTSGIYLRTLWFTTWQAVISTVLTLLLALPGAFVFARYQFRGKELLRSFTTVPFVLPTVVVAAAFHSLLGPHGMVNAVLMKLFHLTSPPVAIDQTIALILIAHVFYNYTVVVRIVGGYWSQLEPEFGGSGQDAGCFACQSLYKSDPAAAQPGDYGGILAGVHFLLFQFRCHPNPGWTALCHHRGGDLPSGDSSFQFADGRRPVSCTNFFYLRPYVGIYAVTAPPILGAEAGVPGGHPEKN